MKVPTQDSICEQHIATLELTLPRMLARLVERGRAELHTRDIMRQQAYAFYRINALLIFEACGDGILKVTIIPEQLTCQRGWRCPATLRTIVELLVSRLVHAHGYRQWCLLEADQAYEEFEKSTTAYYRMLHPGDMPGSYRQDGTAPRYAVQECIPREPGISRDLLSPYLSW
ncbi:hypothetical protein WGP40_11650 [Brachymonas sp. G13]|uniref:hypothetical protein n=1 Tax=Brachymonas TaxID=28219 RepID=UPI0016BAEE3D|nr:hypothetical protein [Brachymonas sp. J145]MEE1654483.1 hypothetical protein [Brachymonas sp. J145]NLX16964.1 hypothetical protein [Ramlibacter sp.]